MMKKILCSTIFIMAVFCARASDMLPAGGYYETQTDDCDMRAMQDELDRATMEHRAVVTVVTCETVSHTDIEIDVDMPAPVVRKNVVTGHRVADCADCLAPVEQVVDRQYFVTETVQRYRPVVNYVPAGTYTRTRPVCKTCGM